MPIQTYYKRIVQTIVFYCNTTCMLLDKTCVGIMGFHVSAQTRPTKTSVFLWNIDRIDYKTIFFEIQSINYHVKNPFRLFDPVIFTFYYIEQP